MLIHKLNHLGDEVWRYPGEILRREENAIVIEAAFNRDDVDLGYTTFKRGDRFVEYFYSDRWYNIFAVYEQNGNFRGWYANICRPATWDDHALSCEDLALDVWVPPTGQPQVQDEDEFNALPLTDAERDLARSGLAVVLTLAKNRLLPK